MKDRTNGAYDRLEASLQQIPRDLGRTPKAVLVISGHWEESEFTVMTTAKPPMIYDYYGFPEHTYQVQYPAPGSPQTAERVRQLLAEAGIPVGADDRRGFDHGTFSPLVVMYPKADVPILQLSMKHGYDPQAHLDVGRALAPLRNEEVLIVGSGLSYHNLRQFGPQARQPSAAFDQWLNQAVVQSDPAEREAQLLAWASAPAARAAHPQEDHLMPLMVAVGAAYSERAARFYHEDAFMGGISVSSFRFG
jgi:aromatic ring-opening dioxygenase catalytic subunit (LigB family)